MSDPDTLNRAFGTLLLALAFSAFIVFVRGHHPGGVSDAWCDLVLVLVAVWLAFRPEAGVLARSLNLVSAPGSALQVGVTLFGCLLGYGVVRRLRRVMREIRQRRSVLSLANQQGSQRRYRKNTYDPMALRIFQMLIRSAERIFHPR